VTLLQDPTSIPSTIYYAACFLQGSQHPRDIIGLTGLILSWNAVFRGALPSFLPGVDIVLSSATQTWKLNIANDKVTVTGQGDFHDMRQDTYGAAASESI
jgi:hypothetical protein